jgi:hypothetical protein
MRMNQIVLNIPDEVLLALKVPLEEAGAALRMAAAGEKKGQATFKLGYRVCER